MFGRIAGRYDLLNHLLSFNLDKRWRARAVARVSSFLVPGARVLDLCCGTGDALNLPLASDSLDLITCAFGFRNLANYDRGLEEFLRVLKPGGMAAILEFSQPTNRAFGALYGFFSHRVLPKVGGMISGSSEAYSYLPESIKRFGGAEALASRMRAAGFQRVEFERMTSGAVALHLGYK